uniref:Serine incorporator n=1 Tax=Bicosoecida sp. CB-2014 TaxID=1486930 RepID=A0A7S1GD00_9STRA|mmetsp:Transcript_3129/g.11204  ORF Transcript_3129/g.11204 Transcript_3129/m.11204 type:complete len:477 (+) Transcript_3129:107-1537(+)
MASIAAGAATSAACCAAGACCSTVTACCCSRHTKSSRRATKVFYLMIVVISVIVALVLRYYGKDMFVHVYSFQFGCGAEGSTGNFQQACFGNQAVFRVSFALAVFFICMMLGSMSDAFDRSYWGIKIGMYLLLLVGSFFIPNEVFNTYADIARVVSALFLILSVIILVDFAYVVQEYLTGRAQKYSEEMVSAGYDEPGTCSNSWLIVYLVVAFVLGVTVLGSLIGMYAFAVHATGSCGGSISLLSLTLIAGLILTVMSTLDMFGGRGLLPPLVVWAYCCYLVWSAFTSNPTLGCNPLASTVNGVTTLDDSPGQIVLGLVITAFSLAYAAYSAASSVPGIMGGGDGDDGETSQPLIGDKPEAERLTAAEDKDEEAGGSDGEAPRAAAGAGGEGAAEEDAPAKRTWLYHLVMCTASIYMAMLLTDWGSNTQASAATQGVSSAAMTVKILSSVITMVLYLWTLLAPTLAPKCCPGRDFS